MKIAVFIYNKGQRREYTIVILIFRSIKEDQTIKEINEFKNRRIIILKKSSENFYFMIKIT